VNQVDEQSLPKPLGFRTRPTQSQSRYHQTQSNDDKTPDEKSARAIAPEKSSDFGNYIKAFSAELLIIKSSQILVLQTFDSTSGTTTTTTITMSSDYPIKSTVPMGNQYPPQYNHTQVTIGEATASMICGIVGLFFFGIILGPIAIFLGVAAKKKIKENPQGLTGEGQATAGIVCGSIAVAGWIILIIFWIVVASAAASTAGST
jgi:hypothetical protein